MQSEISLKLENIHNVLVLETSAISCIHKYFVHVPHSQRQLHDFLFPVTALLHSVERMNCTHLRSTI